MQLLPGEERHSSSKMLRAKGLNSTTTVASRGGASRVVNDFTEKSVIHNRSTSSLARRPGTRARKRCASSAARLL